MAAMSERCRQHDLFANTGIQYLTFELVPDELETLVLDEIMGEDRWIHYEDAPYISRRFKRPSEDEFARFILAIDTTTGPQEEGHIVEDESLLDGSFLGVFLPRRKPEASVFSEERDEDLQVGSFRVLSEMGGSGDPIDVALILDLGNCRTNGLLVELRPHTERFENIARTFRLYEHMDPTRREEVFDTTVVWSTNLFSTYRFTRVEERSQTLERRIFLPKKLRPTPDVETWQETVEVETKLFRDVSLVRLGREAASLRRQFPPERDALFGTSSPKRYLWADENVKRFWQFIQLGEKIPVNVSGKLLGYIYPDDRDWKTGEDGNIILPTQEPPDIRPSDEPKKPCYPRRTMMTLTLFEIFAQAFQQVNSVQYREGLDYGRKRNLTDIVLTFSSAMPVSMRGRYRNQAEKAISIMSAELPGIKTPPRLHTKWDEGIAVQLAYIYGELRAMEMRAGNWLNLVGRRNPKKKVSEVRIATIDIGGGSTDLVIADYCAVSDARGTSLEGKVRYVDGLFRAGDDLARSVIEHLILPQVADRLEIPVEVLRVILGASIPGQEGLRRLRCQWVSDLWTPAARKFLEIAERMPEGVTEGSGESFRLGDICPAPERLRELRRELEKSCGEIIQDPAEVEIVFEPEKFIHVVDNVLGPVLRYAAKTIAKFDCDLTIMAGRVSSLSRIRQLLELYLPMTKGRIIGLHHYKTGEWYPYQTPGRPGEIDDPKTAVVVGAAVAFLSESEYGLRDLQLKLDIHSFVKDASYFWGVASPGSQKIRKEDVIFKPLRTETNMEERKNVRVIGPEVAIARRINSSEESSASPVYGIFARQEGEGGTSDVKVSLERTRGAGEERIIMTDAVGRVGGKRAVPGENVFLKQKTIFEQLYYLDTGVFPNIGGI